MTTCQIQIRSWCGTVQARRTVTLPGGPSLALATAALLAAADISAALRRQSVIVAAGEVTVSCCGPSTAAGTTLRVPLDTRDYCRFAAELGAELAGRVCS